MKRRLATMCTMLMAAATAAAAEEVVRKSPATTPSDPRSTTIVQRAPADRSPATTPATPRAVDLAYRDGVNALRRDVLAAPFSPELTIGQAAGKLDATDALNATIRTAQQPGGPRWRNAICELRMELPGDDVAKVLWEAGRERTSDLGMSSDAFVRHIKHLKTLTFSALGLSGPFPAGVAEARPPAAAPVAPPGKVVPLDPPGWIRRQLDVEGVGEGTGLKGARAAEAVALSELRRQVEALPLSDGLTLRQAVQGDARIDRAISDALRRSRVSRVDYGGENVTVRISLDLDHVWRALTAID